MRIARASTLLASMAALVAALFAPAGSDGPTAADTIARDTAVEIDAVSPETAGPESTEVADSEAPTAGGRDLLRSLVPERSRPAAATQRRGSGSSTSDAAAPSPATPSQSADAEADGGGTSSPATPSSPSPSAPSPSSPSPSAPSPSSPSPSAPSPTTPPTSTPTTPPPPPAPASDACGVRPAKVDGSLWECTFVDEFNGSSLDLSKWYIQNSHFWSGQGTDAQACYRDENVAVSGGALRLTLRPGTVSDCPELAGVSNIFTSGSVSTYWKWSQRYGRFEARMRNTATTQKGLHEAFWLWPDAREVVLNWPFTGEIDISETYSSHPSLTIPFLHYAKDLIGSILSGPDTNTAWHCVAPRGQWNTHRLEWDADKIEIYINGQLCLRNTSGDSAFRHKYIVAFTQLIGGPGNEFDPDAAPPVPATLEVDYVRIWK